MFASRLQLNFETVKVDICNDLKYFLDDSNKSNRTKWQNFFLNCHKLTILMYDRERNTSGAPNSSTYGQDFKALDESVDEVMQEYLDNLADNLTIFIDEGNVPEFEKQYCDCYKHFMSITDYLAAPMNKALPQNFVTSLPPISSWQDRYLDKCTDSRSLNAFKNKAKRLWYHKIVLKFSDHLLSCFNARIFKVFSGDDLSTKQNDWAANEDFPFVAIASVAGQSDGAAGGINQNEKKLFDSTKAAIREHAISACPNSEAILPSNVLKVVMDITTYMKSTRSMVSSLFKSPLFIGLTHEVHMLLQTILIEHQQEHIVSACLKSLEWQPDDASRRGLVIKETKTFFDSLYAAVKDDDFSTESFFLPVMQSFLVDKVEKELHIGFEILREPEAFISLAHHVFSLVDTVLASYPNYSKNTELLSARQAIGRKMFSSLAKNDALNPRSSDVSGCECMLRCIELNIKKYYSYLPFPSTAMSRQLSSTPAAAQLSSTPVSSKRSKPDDEFTVSQTLSEQTLFGPANEPTMLATCVRLLESCDIDALQKFVTMYSRSMLKRVFYSQRPSCEPGYDATPDELVVKRIYEVVPELAGSLLMFPKDVERFRKNEYSKKMLAHLRDDPATWTETRRISAVEREEVAAALKDGGIFNVVTISSSTWSSLFYDTPFSIRLRANINYNPLLTNLLTVFNDISQATKMGPSGWGLRTKTERPRKLEWLPQFSTVDLRYTPPGDSKTITIFANGFFTSILLCFENECCLSLRQLCQGSGIGYDPEEDKMELTYIWPYIEVLISQGLLVRGSEPGCPNPETTLTLARDYQGKARMRLVVPITAPAVFD